MKTDKGVERSERIKNLFKKNGLKQIHVAKAIGATRGTVSKWLSADSVPKGKYLTRLARLLNTTPEYIIDGVLDSTEAMLAINETKEGLRDKLIDELNLDRNIKYDIDYLEELYIEKCISEGNDGELLLNKLIYSKSSDSDKEHIDDIIYVDLYEIANNDGKDVIVNSNKVDSIEYCDLLAANAEQKSVICLTNRDVKIKEVNFGSKCYVDTSKDEIRDGMLYLLKIGDLIVIRRLYRNFDGSISLKTGNETDDVNVDASKIKVLGWLFSYKNIETWQ